MQPSDKTAKGRLIVIEGADGCGKTTQARLLCEHLRRTNRAALLVREPGGTGVGEDVRKILLDHTHGDMSMPAELLLYMACRAQLAYEVIGPALEEGRYVVCDRFLLSSVVYQGHACGLGVDIVRTMGEFAVGEMRPDVQIVLDVSYENAHARRSAESDRIEARGEAFHRRVIEGYASIARGLPSTYIIDANRSLEEVQREIQGITDREIGSKQR